ncbi:MAG TPA: hypothetical protein VGD05_02440, partial [Pyrinomonadaceae bacterium]
MHVRPLKQNPFHPCHSVLLLIMIPISKALKIIEKQIAPLSAEQVELTESVGRVLAENIIADVNLPPFDRSQM